jgi:hypothetical protein
LNQTAAFAFCLGDRILFHSAETNPASQLSLNAHRIRTGADRRHR